MWSCDPYEELKSEIRAEQACRFYFRSGKTCKFGDACAFSHDPSTVKPCNIFIAPQYTCKYGENCQFRHDKPDCKDDREKFDIDLYAERRNFKLDEMRRIYQQEREESKQKYGIMPFHHKESAESLEVLTWDDAMKHLYPVKQELEEKTTERPANVLKPALKDDSNKIVDANDQAIAQVVAGMEFEKKHQSILESASDAGEEKIQADMSEQEKNDVIISHVLMEEEKEKKQLLLVELSNLDADGRESKIASDEKEKEIEKKKDDVASVDGPKPDTPTMKAPPPANTPTTVEAKKKVTISPAHECIPTRLEKKCSMVKEFYDELCRYVDKKDLKQWTPLHIHTLYTETLSVGLGDFHKYEQHLLLNCLFDHWCPSLSDWAEFVTLLHEDIKASLQPDEKEESFILLATELLWWIKDKDDNPIYLGATFAGLLNMPCGEWRNMDIHEMIDTVILELDNKDSVAGVIMAGMSKYLEPEEFAVFVNSYLLSMSCIDVTKCSCTTYECNCPSNLDWEEGVVILEAIIEFGKIEDQNKFFAAATQVIWDSVQTRMVAEEVFFEKSFEEIEELSKLISPIPLTESELEDLYGSSDDTYSPGDDSDSTESADSDDVANSDMDEGLVEYNVEEMEKGNLSPLTALEAAAFKLPETLTDIDANNNGEVTEDNDIGVAIEAAVKTAKHKENKGDKASTRLRRRSLPKKLQSVSPRSPGGRNPENRAAWARHTGESRVSPPQRRSPKPRAAKKKVTPSKDKTTKEEKKPGGEEENPKESTTDCPDAVKKSPNSEAKTASRRKRRRSKANLSSGQSPATPGKPQIKKPKETTTEEGSEQAEQKPKRSPRRRYSGRKKSGDSETAEKTEDGQAVDENNKEEQNADPAAAEAEAKKPNEAQVEEKEEAKPCKTWKGLCRNKGKMRCVQGMCANCCIQTDEECKVHELVKKQKMTRALIPGITGTIRYRRTDYNKIKPFKFFAKRTHFEKYLSESNKEALNRVVFGPHFGIRDEHITKIVEQYGEELLVLELGCAESGDGARLSDKSAFDIAKNCPKLLKLRLESCTGITNEGMEAVLDCCPDLQYFEVSGHDKQKGRVTAEFMQKLFDKKALLKLNVLCLNDQDLKDEGILRRLNRCRPALKIYNTDTYDYDRYMYWGGYWRY